MQDAETDTQKQCYATKEAITSANTYLTISDNCNNSKMNYNVPNAQQEADNEASAKLEKLLKKNLKI